MITKETYSKILHLFTDRDNGLGVDFGITDPTVAILLADKICEIVESQGKPAQLPPGIQSVIQSIEASVPAIQEENVEEFKGNLEPVQPRTFKPGLSSNVGQV